MNDERYVRKGYKIWDTYLDREVQELNYRSQSDYMCEVLNEKESRINTLVKENEQLKKVNNILYNENIQLRRILVNYKDLINDVKYLEEKGVFDGKKDKKNIWDVEPVVEKHS